MARRRAGILLHISSLPGSGPSGRLGPDAYRFVDFLVAAGQRLWQVLPIGPLHDDGSPYQCLSLHAGNPAFISVEEVIREGWLNADEASSSGDWLQSAWAGFRQLASPEQRSRYEEFVVTHSYWLEDYALFLALRKQQKYAGWNKWPMPLRDRDETALAKKRVRLADAIDRARFEQYLFFQQWHSLKTYANQRGVQLFGDMPLFVAHDSADVWARREYFQLDEAGNPTVVAGVPPDYFSATGQRWGNPHYRWERMQAEGFQWWVERLKRQLQLYDLIRIDHFRGLEAYWEIPASEETAIGGRWVQAPGDALFTALRMQLGDLPLVAEDLGVITPEVEALRLKHGFPGMKVLQFAFEGGASNPYLPHNHETLAVVYTGTHDNNTTLGWYLSLPDAHGRYVDEYLAEPGMTMPWPLIRAAHSSVAQFAVVPMQDVLGLDGRYRMNTPGTTAGNWRWRFTWEQLDVDLAGRLYRLSELYGRIGMEI